MAISGKYFIKKWLPDPTLVHGPDFQGGPPTGGPDGTLKGTADGTPINFGYYTGDEFFKVEYPAGPGCWEVWARVDKDGYIEGMISVGGGKGFPNLVYGRKVEA